MKDFRHMFPHVPAAGNPLVLVLAALISSVTLVPAESMADKAYSANEKGIKAYNEKKFEESVNHFTEAVVERPEEPELKFNLGTALSARKRTEDALRQLDSAAAAFHDPEKKAAAYFNAGNTRLAAGDLEGAIEEYRKAVKLDQKSADIRYNLEIAARKLKERRKQQQNNRQNDDRKKKENKKRDEKKKNKNENTNKKKQQNRQEQPSDQKNNENRPMTPEEAKRILDALSDEEKKALSLKKMQVKQELRQGDDW